MQLRRDRTPLDSDLVICKQISVRDKSNHHTFFDGANTGLLSMRWDWGIVGRCILRSAGSDSQLWKFVWWFFLSSWGWLTGQFGDFVSWEFQTSCRILTRMSIWQEGIKRSQRSVYYVVCDGGQRRQLWWKAENGNNLVRERVEYLVDFRAAYSHASEFDKTTLTLRVRSLNSVAWELLV